MTILLLAEIFGYLSGAILIVTLIFILLCDIAENQGSAK